MFLSVQEPDRNITIIQMSRYPLATHIIKSVDAD